MRPPDENDYEGAEGDKYPNKDVEQLFVDGYRLPFREFFGYRAGYDY